MVIAKELLYYRIYYSVLNVRDRISIEGSQSMKKNHENLE